MDVKLLINTILGLPVTNTKANRLKRSVVEKLQSGQRLKLHNGEVNLTWLAELVGCTRQCFYPGRGHDDMRAIVDLLNAHTQILADISSASVTPKLGKLNISIQKVLSENEKLKKELVKNQKHWKDLYNQRLIAD
ncbi:hypothetical protein K5F93_23590 [Pseudomonas protegens]|uniref:hypothetical protein n=1 Tax=Pseudomonas protegens TaxID=380021 RepID=UPI001C8D7463|nr:hypothetical protein [Pseudomonas protegens]QZI69322.1 hypothetical protein K5F93_23590 [Pseudomonas protegens]